MSKFSQGVFDIVKEGGAGFKRFRKENRITLDTLVRLSGFSKKTLRAVESGNHEITMEIAAAYREAFFHSSVGEIFTLTPAEVRQQCQAAQVTDILGHIGALLRAIREQHGSALSAVAERFNLTPMALDMAELGRTVPSERIFAVYRELQQEVFAAPPLPDEVREFLMFIRVRIARLSRAEFAKQAGISPAAVRRIELRGQCQPGGLEPYRRVLAEFKRARARQRYVFPSELIDLRKQGRVHLGTIGNMLGISESAVAHMETRPRQKPLSIKEVWAYYESVRCSGAVLGEDNNRNSATIPLRI